MKIDIKALESAIADAINHPSELLGVCLTVKEAQAVLSMLKEQDIVRCMECKHNTNTIHNPVCELDAYRSGGTDWFCADWERSESG